MDIYIKNMVCNRCVMVVADIFKENGFPDANVHLGKVSVDSPVIDEKLTAITDKLKAAGFEIINDSKSTLIEQIKKPTSNIP